MSTQMISQKDGLLQMKNALASRRDVVFRAVPSGSSAERLEAMAVQALTQNPDLIQCSPASFCLAVMSAAAYGLEIGSSVLGEAYLVPFSRRGQTKKDCQVIIGYKGLLKLARNSGVFRAYSCECVREGDTFEFEDGLDPVCRFRPSSSADRASRPITHVFFACKLNDGTPVVHCMTKHEIDEHARKHSKGMQREDSPWRTSWDAMARKTVLRQVLQSGKIPMASQLPFIADHGVVRAVDSLSFSDDHELIEAYEATNEIEEREPGQEG